MTTARSSGAGGGRRRPSAPSSRRPPSRTTAGSSSTSSSDAPAGAGERLVAGRVGRAHGLDGSFHVSAAIPRLLEPGRAVEVGGESARIERVGGTDARPVVRVTGVSDREAARALTGRSLTVAAEEAPPLGPDEWYAHQLEGCRVTDGEREVGVVRALRELPSCEVLEVDRAEGVDLLVPLVRDAVREVDVEARRVDVDLRFLGADDG